MSTAQVVIVGAGGHGREVLDVLRACSTLLDLDFVGFLDDGNPRPDRLARVQAQHLGPLESLVRLPGILHYVGVGDPELRRRLAARAQELGSRPGPALVHPRAHIGSDVTIGDGSILAPGAVVTTNVRISRHVYLGGNVVVGHDSTLADFVSVYPSSTISGNCTVEEGATIGTNAAVRQGTRIGKGAVVGAGAAVVKDVAASSVVAGVPARPM